MSRLKKEASSGLLSPNLKLGALGPLGIYFYYQDKREGGIDLLVSLFAYPVSDVV